MLVFKKAFLILAALSAMVVPAFAATADRGGVSNFVVWAFLAACGLIILVQVFPLIRKMNEDSEMTAEKARLKKEQKAH
jgi:hypothetical protein